MAEESILAALENQSFLLSELKKAEKELDLKLEELKSEEDKVQGTTNNVLIAQQNLRTASENLTAVHEKYKRNARVLQVLVQQLSRINSYILDSNNKIEKTKFLKNKYKDIQREYEEKVKTMEEATDETDAAHEKLKTQFDKLLNKKKKLEKGDILLNLITNGQGLETIADQKKAVLKSVDDKKYDIEVLMAEIEKKQDMLKGNQEGMKNDETHHQTRMQAMQKQLEELEATAEFVDLDFDSELDEEFFMYESVEPDPLLVDEDVKIMK